ncbi:hypothetical protein [Curtobacterium sp. MCSS17_007]|uniref:hypothetical protein n=1 Tax=Curtobacterium sp. MCSS17_007 TaxID=2175646 RepID=UPI0021ACF62D|nr:hypothetical protein [Curtobacterium sp. MCSS17_007]WIE74935.1 hypothetical protein DEJ22_011800 [Curtobacterium sp. MCSS17_007]
MANLNRILGMASKVIDKQMQKQRAQGNGAAGNQQNPHGSGVGPTGATSSAAPRTS